MSFDSLQFLAFVLPVFAVHWICRTAWQQNLVLFAAAMVFYGWVDVRMPALLLAVTVVGYGYGLVRPRIRPHSPVDRLVLILVCLALFGTLAYFKYANFFLAQFARAFGLGDASPLRIVLPVGISFYVFIAAGYVFDVYRRQVEPERNLLTYLAFSTFFPQLLAGPIGRSSLLPQYRSVRRFDAGQAFEGSRMFLWGLFKKTVVADNCAAVADALLASDGNGLAVWSGMFFFTLQIYFDFSGYSEMAVGTGRWFGIRLMRNFACPYFAGDIAEFWRRWHISLTTWFRDYLYIPLGGSRCSRGRRTWNTIVVFLVSGLWHGANWTYVLWGAFHAVAFLPLLLRNAGRRRGDVDPLSFSWGILPTFVLALVGWTFFKAPDVTVAFARLGTMFAPGRFGAIANVPESWVTALVVSAVALSVEWINRREEFAFARLPSCRWMRCAIYYATALAILCLEPASQAFVYFKF